MNVASVERCEELYHLSGWNETEYFYQLIEYSDLSSGYFLTNPALEAPLTAQSYPAYDLGYLLRRLPQNTWIGYVDTSRQRGYALATTYAWNTAGTDIGKIAECRADTPEDAACLLAIEVLRQGASL